MQIASPLARMALWSLAMLGLATSATMADSLAEDQQCFDAVVSARTIQQVPSEIPDCGDNCIVMRWPWFVDLKIERILKGQVPRKQFSALAIMHTYITSSPLVWGLRRNTDGGFNAQPFASEQALLCGEATTPAKPYIRPEPGQTLDDLRQAGEHRYGRHP